MALILAIESDRRQASQLAAIVRGRLHAELVIAESAESALSALGDRVPDLILTSALLSPKDEAALGERLRALDSAAAHVQTLTIPMLAPSKARPASGRGGVLSALRRGRAKAAATDGCDPAVFAEQCQEYLERAEHERLTHLADSARTSANADYASVRPSAEKASVSPSADSAPVAPNTVAAAAHAAVRDEAAAAQTSPAIETAAPIPVEPPIEAAPTQAAPAPPPVVKAREIPPPSLIAAVAALEAFEANSKSAEPEVVPSFEAEAAPWFEAEPVPEPAHALQTAPELAAPLAAEVADPLAAEASDPLLAEFMAPPASESAATPACERAPEPPHESLFEPLLTHLPELALPLTPESMVTAPPGWSTQFAPDPLIEALAETFPEPPPAAAAAEPASKSVLELDLTTLFDEAAEDPTAASQAEDDQPIIYEIDTSLDLTMEGLDAVLAARVVAIGQKEDEADEPEPEPARLSETELYTPLPWMATRWPPLESHVVNSLVAAAADEIKRGDFEEPQEWLDIIEALRRDAQQMKFARSDPAQAETVAKKKRRAPGAPVSRRGPVQDEWGFFDPQKCGFAALLAKLEEITDQEDGPAPRGA